MTGTGERRTLTYNIRQRAGQTVAFWDSTGRAARLIGHATGAHGSLHFSAPPGGGRRTIYAQFTLAGLPAERIAVAHYLPPAPTLATPRGLQVTRKGNRLTISFKPVTDATGYEITLTDPLTGYQHLTRTRPAPPGADPDRDPRSAAPSPSARWSPGTTGRA